MALKQQAVEELYKLKQSNSQAKLLSHYVFLYRRCRYDVRIDTFSLLATSKATLRSSLPFILPPLSTLPKIFKSRKEIGIRIFAHPITTLPPDYVQILPLTASLPIRRTISPTLHTPN